MDLKRIFYLLFIGCIIADIKLHKCYNSEITSKPKNLNVCYWSLTNIVAMLGFATQVFIPFKVIFNKLTNRVLIGLWLYCVIGNTLFRLCVYYKREYLHTIGAFWAFFNDFNSWALVPFILYKLLTKEESNMILDTGNSDAVKKKKMYMLVVCTLICITVDVVEFATNIDGLAQWWVYAVRVPVVLLTTIFMMRQDKDEIRCNYGELVMYMCLYNLLQIVLNDLPYIIKNIIINTNNWKINKENYNSIQGAFLIFYALFFWFIARTLKLLLVKLPANTEILRFIFIFYDTYMMAMLVVTNNLIDYKLFILIGLVMGRKLFFSFFELCDILPCKYTSNKELALFETILKQIGGYICYFIAIISYITDYNLSGTTWLGQKEKTYEDLITKLKICNIYLASELFLGLIFYSIYRIKKLSNEIVKAKLKNLFDDHLFYLIIVTTSYMVHVTFFWEPL